MKKAEKMLIIFMIIICSFVIIPQSEVRADDEAKEESISVSGIVKGIRPTDPTEDKYSDLAEVVGKILGFLQIASGITTVIMIAFLGFELITSMPETREAIKKKMFPIIIGIMLVFGATSIASFIISVNGG
jgi:type IV secretory pathway VirB2 component (pilin)